MDVVDIPIVSIFRIYDFTCLERGNMNKGLEIRNNKRRKNAIKRNTIKPEQENICRFVELQWEVIEMINGKYRHTGRDYGKGLQLKNRVYLTTGHYKLINSKSVKITKKYDDIPDWATEELIEKYHNNK